MHTNKKPLMRLCLSFTMVGVFVLAAIVTSQAAVSAASPKGSMFSPHITVKQPSGVKPNAGVRPNTVCEAVATGSTGCPLSVSPSFTGALTVSVGDPSTIASLELTGSGSQHIDFSFPSAVVDTTSSGGWTLTATSAGLTVPGSATPDPFLIASPGVAVICTVVGPPASCSSTTNVTPAAIGASLVGGLDYATVASSARDTGSTTITTNLTVPLGATTTAGSASGSITVTAAASV